MNYSERIQLLAEMVDCGSAADIGTDHAYVPRILLENGYCSFVIATDINEGPLAIAKENLQDLNVSALPWGEQPECHLRLGAGLEPIEAGEVESVVIAGMGGETIADILSADPEKTKSFKQFILQPRSKAEVLRKWLVDNNMFIVNEKIVKEGLRFCQVIDARTEIPVYFEESGGLAAAPYERFTDPIDYIYPPFLIEDMRYEPVIREYMESEKRKTAEVLKNMRNAADPQDADIEFRRKILRFLEEKTV